MFYSCVHARVCAVCVCVCACVHACLRGGVKYEVAQYACGCACTSVTWNITIIYSENTITFTCITTVIYTYTHTLCLNVFLVPDWSVVRRGSQPGRIVSCGGSNPEQQRTMMGVHPPALMTARRMPSKSSRTATPVTPAMESVTTSLSKQPSAWR